MKLVVSLKVQRHEFSLRCLLTTLNVHVGVFMDTGAFWQSFREQNIVQKSFFSSFTLSFSKTFITVIASINKKLNEEF